MRRSKRRKVVTRSLKAIGLAEGQLAALRKGDQRTAQSGALTRKSTTASHSWIAERLKMRSRSPVSRYGLPGRWNACPDLAKKLAKQQQLAKYKL